VPYASLVMQVLVFKHCNSCDIKFLLLIFYQMFAFYCYKRHTTPPIPDIFTATSTTVTMEDPDTVSPFSSEVHADAVRAFALSYALGGVTILLKGEYDIVASSDYAGTDWSLSS
jgi:hypothetical protein